MQEKFLRVRTQGKCRRKANRRESGKDEKAG